MIVLMQAEVERFHAGIVLLHDFYQIKVQDVAGDNSVALVSVFVVVFLKHVADMSGGTGCARR